MSKLTDMRQALQQSIDLLLDVIDCRSRLSLSSESVHISKTAGQHPQTIIRALRLIGNSSSTAHLYSNDVKASMESREGKDIQAAASCKEALL